MRTITVAAILFAAYRYSVMERRPPRGAPISTPASMPAASIRSSNAWPRFRETVGFARQINSRTPYSTGRDARRGYQRAY